jgi:hypothetical protein
VLAAPSSVDLGFEAKPPQGGDPYCQARWCWSDAIFMAPPAWIALTKETQDPRYLAHADSEFWATTDLLYDKTDHLYFRDSRFIAKRSDAGAKIFWGRGNGWAFAGIARILQDLPKDHPSRPRYEALFKQMAAKIVTLQGEQGYWPVSLLEPQKTPRDQRHGLLRLRPGLGREPRPAAGRPVPPGDRQGLDRPDRRDRAGRQAGLGAARGRRARPGGSRRHPALRRRRLPAGRQRGVEAAVAQTVTLLPRRPSPLG